jgi:formylglycine-generating enzyme required for sulfatase activity/ribosomal protein L40E
MMSINCNSCGRQNSVENAFCGGCGKPLGSLSTEASTPHESTESTCVRCGATMPPGASFCGICGKSLESGVQKKQTDAAGGSGKMPTTVDKSAVRPDSADSEQSANKPAPPPRASAEPQDQRSGKPSGEPSAAGERGESLAGPTSAAEHPFRSGQLLREMVVIPAGNFMMGSLPDYGNKDECPRHSVRLSRFQVDRFTVSNIEYEQFRPEHHRQRTPTSSGDLDPVVFVTFEEAMAYCDWRSEQEGLPHGTYRLPTEAQWEYCARGGQDSLFPWGDEIIEGACNTREIGLGKAVPVDEGLPNGFNLLHLGSNVREWCFDWYNDAYYAMEASSGIDPQGPPAIEFVNMKVVRGASFQDLASELSRCAARNYAHPRSESDDTGFRCVRDA